MTIISIIVKSYFQILIAIGGVAMLIFLFGTYLIFRLARSNKNQRTVTIKNLPAKSKSSDRNESPDVHAIAGEDPVSTQLDLARAYIESGKNQLAKIILESVAETGCAEHQEEAQRLLSSI